MDAANLKNILEAAHQAALSSEPRDGGMNAAWKHGYGTEGEYTSEARMFCIAYNFKCDEIGKRFQSFQN